MTLRIQQDESSTDSHNISSVKILCFQALFLNHFITRVGDVLWLPRPPDLSLRVVFMGASQVKFRLQDQAKRIKWV